MKKNNFLIYGANGYTGQLIVKQAIQQGLRPVLAGRNHEKISAEAKHFDLDYRIFDINDVTKATEVLNEFVAVIHCAGPFIDTYKQMVAACLAAHTHYLDITGEVEVIEKLSEMNEQAKSAKIMILPGAGFDVVPSDCLAQHLKSRLPDAIDLTLAISTRQESSTGGLGISRGTAKSMANGLTARTLIRQNGQLVAAPDQLREQQFNFGNHHQISCMLISWGDLASAWWSTRIPNIKTYMSVPKKMISIFNWMNLIKFVFKWDFVQKLIKNKINKMPEGPNIEMRKHSSTLIFGEARNNTGKKVASILKTPNGYDFTAMTSIAIVQKILAAEVPIGFQTPSTAYGKDWVLALPSISRIDIY